MNYKNRCADIDKLKVELDSFRPFDENTLKQLKEYYRISLTYTSNAIEGNTLTESETKVIIEDGITIGGHPIREIQEALGHSKAYDLIYNLLQQNSDITENNILELHRLFYEQIDPSNAGKYRDKKVIITGTTYEPPSPDKLQGLIQNLISQLHQKAKTMHPVEFAAWLHLHFVNIHPFIDGNGRTARLLTNLVLLKAGYSIVIIPPIVRADYIESLKAAQTEQNEQAFFNFISEMVLESMKDYLRIVKHLKE